MSHANGWLQLGVPRGLTKRNRFLDYGLKDGFRFKVQSLSLFSAPSSLTCSNPIRSVRTRVSVLTPLAESRASFLPPYIPKYVIPAQARLVPARTSISLCLQLADSRRGWSFICYLAPLLLQ